MTARRANVVLLVALAAGVVAGAAAPAVSAAPYTGPIKEILTARVGHEVNLTEVEKHGGVESEDVCLLASGDTCQPGRESEATVGFSHPNGVAVQDDPASPDYGDVYVADTGNHRVQELTPAGRFVRMFGWDVNRTKVEAAAPQAERDVCTAASGDVCQAGVEGGLPEQFGIAYSLTVTPASGDVYVEDGIGGRSGGEFASAQRVQGFTAAGRLVLEIGKEVNEATHGNACDLEEAGAKCKGAALQTTTAAQTDSEPGAFNFSQGFGDILAIGGPNDTLYVGDEHRVQEFDASTGAATGEIPLASISSALGSKVVALAVDGGGDVYLAYAVDAGYAADVVYEFDGAEALVHQFHVREPLSPNATVSIHGMAIDAQGRLSVLEGESLAGAYQYFGTIYDAATGHASTEFLNPGRYGSSGVSFDGETDKLYAAGKEDPEILTYAPVHVAELMTASDSCTAGAEVESSVTLDCVLNGEVNPEEVPATTAWFQWGATSALGSETSRQSIATGDALTTLTDTIVGVRPNQTVYYRVAGEDEEVKSPEQLTSETATFTTPIVAPRVVGTPSATFVTDDSAVMFAELNPENTDTTYAFQYGECEENDPLKCSESPYTAQTATLQSAVYGKIGATLEARGLRPGEVYHYRLLASDERVLAGKTVGGTTTGAEADFTTEPASAPQALTGAASVVGASAATIAGTVDPEGQAATYAFELGVYAGQATQYVIAFSGSAGAGVVPVEETLGLTGLQPGVTYAYRIKVASGDGEAYGATETFTTVGLPAVLEVPPVLARLPVSAIAFPVEEKPKPSVKCKRGFTRDKRDKCVKAKSHGRKKKGSRHKKSKSQKK